MNDANAPMHSSVNLARRGVRLVDFFAGLTIGALACTVMLQVIARYLLQISLDWTSDISTLLLIWATFLGAAVASFSDEHFAVGFVVDALPSSLRPAADLFANMAVTVTLLALLFYGCRYTLVQMSQQYSGIAISKGWATLAIPVSALLMLPRYVTATYVAWTRIVGAVRHERAVRARATSGDAR